MKQYNTIRSFISYMSESPLLSRKSTFFITVFILFSALFTGVFFSYCISSADKEYFTDPLIQMFHNESFSAFPGLLTNLLLLLFIFLSGLSVYGFAFSFIILAGKSFSLGFCTWLFYCGTEEHSLGSMLFTLLPANIVLLAAFAFASSVSLNYAFAAMQNTSLKQQYTKLYFILFAVFVAAVFFSSFIESLSFRFIQST